jgi:hypothetical protein
VLVEHKDPRLIDSVNGALIPPFGIYTKRHSLDRDSKTVNNEETEDDDDEEAESDDNEEKNNDSEEESDDDEEEESEDHVDRKGDTCMPLPERAPQPQLAHG